MWKRQWKQTSWIWISILTYTSTGLPFWSLLAGIGAGTIAITATSIQAATLTSWQFNPNTRQLEVTVPQGTTPRYFLLAEPTRIVLDLPNTQVGSVPEQQSYSGAVRRIRVSQFQPDVARLVIELAPDTTLASGQVELRRADGASSANQRGDRWVLRPLLAGDPAPSVAQAPQATAPQPTVSAPVTDSAPNPAAEPPASPAPTPNAPSVTAGLPPLEPNAVEIPVDQPQAGAQSVPAPAPSIVPVPPDVAATANRSPNNRDTSAAQNAAPIAEPSPPTTTAATPPPTPQPAPPARQPDRAPSSSRSPSTSAATPPASARPPQAAAATNAPALPPATTTSNRPASVSVPSLNAESATPPAASRSTAALPPAMPSAQANQSQVRVPSAQSAPAQSSTLSPSTGAPAVIDFGQPLSNESIAAANSSQNIAVALTGSILIPAGTVLQLRYPGDAALQLSADAPQQEVLLLEQAVVDQFGNLVVPQGSQVIGRFETSEAGSKFIAQALSVGDRNLLFNAESEPLEGDRDVEDNHLLRNSALGVLAGTLLGGVGGALLGGAAAGATTYLTSPQPAVIQPNQIVQIRLTEDLQQQ